VGTAPRAFAHPTLAAQKSEFSRDQLVLRQSTQPDAGKAPWIAGSGRAMTGGENVLRSVTLRLTTVSVSVTCTSNLARQGRRRGGYSPGVGASAVPAGGAIHSVLGRLGHQPAGTMTGARGARWTGTGWGGCHARSNCARSAPPGWGELTGPDAPAASQEAIGP